MLTFPNLAVSYTPCTSMPAHAQVINENKSPLDANTQYTRYKEKEAFFKNKKDNRKWKS